MSVTMQRLIPECVNILWCSEAGGASSRITPGTALAWYALSSSKDATTECCYAAGGFGDLSFLKTTPRLRNLERAMVCIGKLLVCQQPRALLRTHAVNRESWLPNHACSTRTSAKLPLI